MRYWGVVGRPIIHSKSPFMHNAGFKALGIDGRYLRLSAATFGEGLELARQLGLEGFNITAPFKEEALPYLQTIDHSVARTGAVNTVKFSPEGLIGFNTDYTAIKTFLPQAPLNREALVLGAGGAARAAAAALVDSGFHVTIANRTFERAALLAQEFGAASIDIGSESIAECAPNVSVFVSTVPNDYLKSLSLPLPRRAVIIEADYRLRSLLAEVARRESCIFFDGLDWLHAQGAAAFEIFTGSSAPKAAMRAGLSETLCGDNLALIGMMGSGKSTLAAALGLLLGWPVVDLDREIEREHGATIAEIFTKSGEAHFRNLESTLLTKVLEHRGQIIACGGGIISRAANREALCNRATVALLHARLDDLATRTEGTARPLLRGDRLALLKSIWEERKENYLAAADLVVSTTVRSVSATVQHLAREFKKEDF